MAAISYCLFFIVLIFLDILSFLQADESEIEHNFNSYAHDSKRNIGSYRNDRISKTLHRDLLRGKVHSTAHQKQEYGYQRLLFAELTSKESSHVFEYPFEIDTFSAEKVMPDGERIVHQHNVLIANTTAFVDDFVDLFNAHIACYKLNSNPQATAESEQKDIHNDQAFLPGETEQLRKKRSSFTLQVQFPLSDDIAPLLFRQRLWRTRTVVLGISTLQAAGDGKTPGECSRKIPEEYAPVFNLLHMREYPRVCNNQSEPSVCTPHSFQIDLAPSGLLAAFAAAQWSHRVYPSTEKSNKSECNDIHVNTSSSNASMAHCDRKLATYSTDRHDLNYDPIKKKAAAQKYRISADNVGSKLECDRCYASAAASVTAEIQFCAWAYLGIRFPKIGGGYFDLRIGLGPLGFGCDDIDYKASQESPTTAGIRLLVDFKADASFSSGLGVNIQRLDMSVYFEQQDTTLFGPTKKWFINFSIFGIPIRMSLCARFDVGYKISKVFRGQLNLGLDLSGSLSAGFKYDSRDRTCPMTSYNYFKHDLATRDSIVSLGQAIAGSVQINLRPTLRVSLYEVFSVIGGPSIRLQADFNSVAGDAVTADVPSCSGSDIALYMTYQLRYFISLDKVRAFDVLQNLKGLDGLVGIIPERNNPILWPSFPLHDEEILPRQKIRSECVPIYIRQLEHSSSDASVMGLLVPTSSLLHRATRLSRMLLVDTVPLSLGIQNVYGVFIPVIERGTILPTKTSITFSTYSDKQPGVMIVIYEGARAFTRDNTLLGKFQLDGIPAMPRGILPIEVTFELDLNGILKVSAIEKSAGKEGMFTITNDKFMPSKEESDRVVAEADKFKIEDDAKIQAINEFENNCCAMALPASPYSTPVGTYSDIVDFSSSLPYYSRTSEVGIALRNYVTQKSDSLGISITQVISDSLPASILGTGRIPSMITIDSSTVYPAAPGGDSIINILPGGPPVAYVLATRVSPPANTVVFSFKIPFILGTQTFCASQISVLDDQKDCPSILNGKIEASYDIEFYSNPPDGLTGSGPSASAVQSVKNIVPNTPRTFDLSNGGELATTYRALKKSYVNDGTFVWMKLICNNVCTICHPRVASTIVKPPPITVDLSVNAGFQSTFTIQKLTIVSSSDASRCANAISISIANAIAVKESEIVTSVLSYSPNSLSSSIVDADGSMVLDIKFTREVSSSGELTTGTFNLTASGSAAIQEGMETVAFITSSSIRDLFDSLNGNTASSSLLKLDCNSVPAAIRDELCTSTNIKYDDHQRPIALVFLSEYIQFALKLQQCRLSNQNPVTITLPSRGRLLSTQQQSIGKVEIKSAILKQVTPTPAPSFPKTCVSIPSGFGKTDNLARKWLSHPSSWAIVSVIVVSLIFTM